MLALWDGVVTVPYIPIVHFLGVGALDDPPHRTTTISPEDFLPMQCTKLKTYMETGRVVFLPPRSIWPNPAQPRKVFSEEELRQLADSIRQHGILQPLSVRRVDAHYELIAGERRYRASQLAGLKEIPCIVMRMDDRESGLTALMENLQRQDLNFVEEARAFSALMSQYSLSQEQVAQAVGKSQSAVANKLRLLRHSPAVLDALLEGNLTERHGRALLKLEGEGKKLSAISHITRNHLSVAQTEQYVDSLVPSPSALRAATSPSGGGALPPGELSAQLTERAFPGDTVGAATCRPPDPTTDTVGDGAHDVPPHRTTQKLLRRIHRAVKSLQENGTQATFTREETPTHITLTLQIPK